MSPAGVQFVYIHSCAKPSVVNKSVELCIFLSSPAEESVCIVALLYRFSLIIFKLLYHIYINRWSDSDCVSLVYITPII